jgi:hypothetical protein
MVFTLLQGLSEIVQANYQVHGKHTVDGNHYCDL